MNATDKLNSILERLQGVKKNGSGYMALCPAHDDQKPSLSVTEQDGRVLLHCHAGCEYKDIAAALGIEKQERRIEAVYDYADESGRVLFSKIRYEGKDFRCRLPDGTYKLNGVRRVLYNLPAVVESPIVFVPEGERDCDTLKAHGFTATTNFDGASKDTQKPKWKKEYNEYFKDKIVYILPDNDNPGRAHAANIYQNIKPIAADCKIVELPDLREGQDVTDWFNKGGTLEKFTLLCMDAPEGIPKNWKTDTPHKAGLSLNIISADQIQEEDLTWFWDNRIPGGMYSFVVGDPGAGKSFLSCYFAAVASTGGLWGDGLPFGDPVDVLMFVSEDHISKVFVQRLRAAGADMNRIKICQWIKSETADEIPFVIQQNIDILKNYLIQNPRCKLVTLDPITGYMGDANQNSQADVREALIPVKHLAETMDITVVGFSHLNKKVDMDMQHRSIGSVAFNAVPRAVWGVFAKEDDDGFSEDKRRFFFPIKDNLCINPDAMEFSIIDNAVVFGGKLSRQEMNNQIDSTKKTPTKKEQAKEIILNALQDGDIESDALIQIVTSQGISERTATDARKELRASGKIDTHNPEGKGFKWLLC